MTPISVVSRIRSTLKPSTPRKYSAPIEGIHGSRSWNWYSGFCGLYQNHSGTETANPATANRLAIHLIAFSLRLLTKSSRIAPASGVNRITERMFDIDLSREQVHGHERENADQHQERVVLHQPGLQP